MKINWDAALANLSKKIDVGVIALDVEGLVLAFVYRNAFYQ